MSEIMEIPSREIYVIVKEYTDTHFTPYSENWNDCTDIIMAYTDYEEAHKRLKELSEKPYEKPSSGFAKSEINVRYNMRKVQLMGLL